MPTAVVLHLTDLHFGDDQDPSKLAARKNCLDSLIETVAALEPDWRPTMVCISGDIGWSGSASDYDAAGKWLTTLLTRIDVPFANVVVCAGNHDIDRKLAKKLSRPGAASEADDVLGVPIAGHYLNCFAEFSAFCKRVGIQSYTFNGTESYLVGQAELQGVRFVALNSAWFCRGADDKGKLWIGIPHLQKMQADGQVQLAKDSTESPVVALIHHPGDWWHDSECNAYDSRPNSRDWFAQRCHLILNGHTHGEVRKADRIAESALHLTGGAGFAGTDHFNSFRCIQVQSDGIQYRSFEFDPRSSENVWRAHKPSSFLRFREAAKMAEMSPALSLPPIPREYLAWLEKECAILDQPGVRRQEAQTVRLTQVYVPPVTPRDKSTKDNANGDEEQPGQVERTPLAHDEKPQLLLELLDTESLYVDGPPGSGKTTFALWAVGLCCSGQLPQPALDAPEGYVERFPESLRGRLPVLIRLREFWDHLPKVPGGNRLSAEQLKDALAKRITETKPGGVNWECVDAYLKAGRAFLVFDGFDEVPLSSAEGPP